jgi:hypothetical protein
MTSPVGRRRRLFGRVRLAGAATAALALAALIAIGPPTTAQADTPTDSYNQMTGSGLTATALTVNWTSGLLNAENQPITTGGCKPGQGPPDCELSPNSDRQAYAAGQPTTSPLSFMYADFKNIKVTVSQTDNIGHQGIGVSWSGFAPGQQLMQLMECWGDADTGPSPENCEYGSLGMNGPLSQNVGNRGDGLCKAGSPSTTNPAKPVQDPGDPGAGCDPIEPTSESPAHCNPDQTAVGDRCPDGTYEIPFVGVDDTTHPIYTQANLPADFTEFNSNEIQYARSAASGTGNVQFEALTSVEAPHLGCGDLESDGKPRGCWLVMVPRGNFEPNGFKLTTGEPDGDLQTTPLSASNWAQRIQVHLNYAPLGSACPPTVLPDQVVGTRVITRAVDSWELALNLAANCNTVYSFTPAPSETTTTSVIRAAAPGSGAMAFTTIPIGSEATRYTTGVPPSMPNVLYAPVAVTAMDFGFNINDGLGYVATPVKLTPQLLGRALTQVYRDDLPDYGGSDVTRPGPAWSQNNPGNISLDPAFKALNSNSSIAPFLETLSLAPLLTEDHSQLNQQVWQWVQSDPATAAWLDKPGTPTDPVTPDPDYLSLSPQLGKAPAQDSFPRAYKGVYDNGVCPASQCGVVKEIRFITADLLPYAPDIGTGAARVLAADDTAYTSTGQSWSLSHFGPDGNPGWWSKAGVEPPGFTFMWALSDMPDIASYGLIAAQLCAPSGAKCVGPSLDSVRKTVDAATPDRAGLLEINPAKVPSGGYPLVQVVYAAVPTKQSAQSLTDYANLIKYAANQGQAVGTTPGNLPAGYLPLTAKLRAQANAVVAKLQKLANPAPTTSPTPSTSPHPTTTGSMQPTTSAPAQTSPATGPQTTPAAGQTSAPATATTLPASPTSTACASSTPAGASPPPGCGAASASASPSAQGPLIVSPTTSAQLASGNTQPTVVSNIRLVLIAVLIIGAVGSVTGTALRADWRPFRRRSRGPS